MLAQHWFLISCLSVKWRNPSIISILKKKLSQLWAGNYIFHFSLLKFQVTAHLLIQPAEGILPNSKGAEFGLFLFQNSMKKWQFT